MKLLLDELVHLALALGVGLIFYWRYRRWELILSALFVGVLIDVDHLIDYFLYFGARINLSNFFNVKSYMEASGKIYVFFHAWEWVIFLWFGGRWLGKKKRIKGLEWVLSLAYLVHLVWDCCSCSCHPRSYLITYRALNGFSFVKPEYF